jgi:SAM-dependent methyltransferase
MKRLLYCLVCGSAELQTLKEHVFRSPGQGVEDHLVDMTRVRLWILFEKIAEGRGELVFESTLCRACGLIVNNPRFTDAEMALKYQTIAELDSVQQRMAADPPVEPEKRAQRIAKLAMQFIGPGIPEGQRMLDYGGGAGHNSAPFVGKLGAGVLDYERWKLPAGVSCLGRDLADLESSDRFRLILLLHTLEHVLQPRELIEQLCSHLTDDGLLYVEVPLGCFNEWRFMSEPLTHINFFSEESMFKCFERCGLNVLYLDTAYQRVSRAKMWCVTIIGTKQETEHSIRAESVPSTASQMAKRRYYLPYLLNWRIGKRVVRRLIRM